MKKIRTVSLSAAFVERLKSHPFSMSAAIAQAITNAHHNNELLTKALLQRMTKEDHVRMDDRMKTSISFDTRLEPYLEGLSAKSHLSSEEVIRLASEAFVDRL